MNKDIQIVANRIKDLITKNEDAVKGFDKAAENATEIGMKSYFEKRSAQRRLFVKTLHKATPALETRKTKIEGSFKGAAHRAWMDTKIFVSNDTDEAMLEEVVRGDKAAIEAYNEVLAETMIPHRLKEIIREQRDVVQNDLETSELLEEFA